MASFGILTLITLIVDIRAYRKKHGVWNLIPPVFAVIVVAITIYKDVQRQKINRMENVMIVSNQRGNQYDNNRITYCFKKGNRFTVSEYKKSTEIMYHGKYSMTGDSIQIISSNYRSKRYILPKEGIIRDSTIYWKNSDSMKIITSEELHPVR
ncbi:MAG TPA: hypothetical protein VHM26_00255 [Chitinophagaceae bacterium]|jgi:hypothetical protein|nr:hypothetical protein [Chitinophagaceae bacterium]